jgi:lipid-binding SYLF domain-containing protein
MKLFKLTTVLLVFVLFFSGFWSGKSERELRKERFKARVERIEKSHETLELLYKYAPEAREMLQEAYGYATFSNIGVNLVLLSAEGGIGLAHNNHNGINTYMNMASGGLGFGLGAKDFRAVFLFEDKEAYDNFVQNGWEANAQADAAAKLNENGGAINLAETVARGIRLYKLTQNGLALQATVQGTKYWRDGDLNR